MTRADKIAALSVALSDCVKSGAVSRSGLGAERKDYVSDGTPRWQDRDTGGGTLRWKRPAVNDAEALDLSASLVGVPDDCNGWLLLEDA